MSHDHDHQNDVQCPKTHCGCCGPVEFEFPDELLTPELKKMKKTMSKEEFEEMMKGLM